MSEQPNPSPTAPRPPPPAWYRWLVLVLISMAMFGNYYVYDCVNPLEDLLNKQLGFTADQFGLLQGIYSFPNILMPLFGGILIDRLGAKKAVNIFAAICFLGAILTAVSGVFWMMAAGRLLFGLGAESLIVAVTAGVARWFRGKELSFAFGINLTIARLGSLAADNSPSWAAGAFLSWQKPLMIAVIFALVSVIAGGVYWLLENTASRRYDLGGEGATDKVKFRDLFSFGRSYWYVVALCFTFYSGIFPFRTFAVKFFQSVHEMPLEGLGGASFLNSTLIIGAMIFTPLFGLMVDRVGKRSLFMVVGVVLLAPNYLLMMYAPVSPYLPMVLMGISFALIPAVMWPSVAYLVEQRNLGSALGLMTMLQNFGLMAFNYVIGEANTYALAGPANPGGYSLMMWIFTGLAAVGFFFAMMLRRAESGPHARGLETITTTTGLAG